VIIYLFIPVSGYNGDNVTKKSENFPWYNGCDCWGNTVFTLMEAFDSVPYPSRPIEAPFMAPIHDIYKIGGVGTVVETRVVSGTIKVGDELLIEPGGITTTVKSIELHHNSKNEVTPGDLVGINVAGISVQSLKKGMVLCSPNNPCPSTMTFVVRLRILDHPNGVRVGYRPFCICHTSKFPATLREIRSIIDSRTGKVVDDKPEVILKNQSAIAVFSSENLQALDTFKNCPPLGRIVFRDLNTVIGIGVISELLETEKTIKLTYIGKKKR